MARHGLARLTGAPREPGEVARCIEAFGHVRETNYGRIFDVRVKPDAANLADTDRGLAPHTDNPYRAPPPRLQVLHCLQDADQGGETRLVDGLAAALRLRAENPRAFDLLRRTPIHFEWRDATTRLATCEPLLSVDDAGAVTAIRLNHRSFQTIGGEPDARDAWRDAYRALAAILKAPSFGCGLRLAPGDLLIFDNHRILHGRTAYSGAVVGERHLQGAYAEIDGLYSTLAVLTDAEADRRVATLAALFNSDATLETYGEGLSLRDHMLQTADLAAAQGLDEAGVAAALLHDLGWTLPDTWPARGHEAAAADLLAPLCGPAVADPIRLHVAAKQYLVTREPGYLARLSEASRQTLAQQGGPMAPDACDAFERQPGFAAAVALRRLDDAAKHADHPVGSFDAYAGLLRRVIVAEMI